MEMRDKKGRFAKGNKEGFQKGHKFFKGGEKGWFKKGQKSWNSGTAKPKDKKEITVGEIKKCEWCKNERYFKNSLLKKNKWFFCSLDCYHNFLKGKRMSKKTEFKKGQFTLEKHPNWLGGKSFEPYGIEFNNELKELIRKREKNKCFICGKKENRKLSVHHIDYNKKNNNPKNLIALCNKCHIQTNTNREEWEKFFQSFVRGGIK